MLLMSDAEATRVRLWWPTERCLGGICLGTTREEILARGDFVEDVPSDPDDLDDEGDLRRLAPPEMSVTMSDGIAVSITAFDECLLDEVNLIGLPLDAVAWRVGGIAQQTMQGEVGGYETGSGVELWVRDGVVCQVHISDWSLVTD